MTHGSDEDTSFHPWNYTSNKTTNKMKRRNPSAMSHSKSQAESSSTTASQYHFHYASEAGGNNSTGNLPAPSPSSVSTTNDPEEHNDRMNYALLIALYTLQGIPMGLSASIPFLIQQKLQALATANNLATSTATVASAASAAAASSSSDLAAAAAKLSYKANAIFALCSWPFSLKLLWAPIVDACFLRGFGRRKSWLVPVQALAGLLMVLGSNFVEHELGLGHAGDHQWSLENGGSVDIKGVTIFFFCLYALMATQDIAVDGWALTMLSKKNRGRGPICNSIGQNIGYFLSFVGFLALNDAESSEMIWRPLLGLPSNPDSGIVSLGGFIRFMGYFMLATTTAVALFKHEESTLSASTRATISGENTMPKSSEALLKSDRLTQDPGQGRKNSQATCDEDHELDASEIGLKETYRRLWAVCKLPSVRWLFVILLTYRLPTALNDNVKFLKAVEYGLSKSTTALLSPTVILPLGIAVPILATRIWHRHPLRQFMTAYKFRVTLVPLLDAFMLYVLHKNQQQGSGGMGRLLLFWTTVISSTAMQAIVNSLQFNAQMTFFASRVDPAIGGSYMTLLNTAANLGGTYPASFVMWLVSVLTKPATCTPQANGGGEVCTGGRDPYFVLQIAFSVLGCLWIAILGRRVDYVAHLPEDSWRTHLLDKKTDSDHDDVRESTVNESGNRPFFRLPSLRSGSFLYDAEAASPHRSSDSKQL
mmetsp:Transcript_5386/g.11065  ORF Transcript_5386/g.11065 Transcript_5386/m.11065 type:complete len:708 (-) Transcript_5386:32-2155(-)